MGSGASTNLKKEFLRKSSVFGSLSDEQLTALAKCFVVKTKQKDSFLENIPNIICVGRGELKVYSGSSGGSGARSEMNYLCTKKPGDVLVPFPLSSRRMFRTVTLSSGFGGEEEEEKAAAAAAAGPAAPLGGARSGTRQSSYLDDQQDPATARRGAAAATTSRARVLCGTDCQLLYLEPGAVRGLAKKAATADLALILGKLGQDLAALAGGLRFLAEAAPPELQLFAELCSYESHAAGAAVLEQGASGDKFYLVLHGGCDVLIATGPPPPSGEEEAEAEEAAAADAGVRPAAPVAHVVERRGSAVRARLVATRSGKLSVQPVAKKKEPPAAAAAALASPAERPMATVAHLKEGQYFGEMALMVNMPRSCTIRATTDCLFAVMDKRRFRKFLKACPRVRRAMEADMCERLLDQLRALDLPLLAAFPPAKVPPRRLAECCRLHEYGAGDVVVRKGDPVSGAFFTLHGELELVRAKLAPLKRRSYIIADRNGQVKLRRGNSFGEETIRAELPDAPRRAAGLEEGEGGGGGGPAAAAAAAARATAQYTVMALKDTVVLEVTAAAAGLIRGDASLTARFRLCQLREDCGLTHVLEDAAAARHLLAFLRAEHSEEGLEFLRAVRAFRAGCAAAAAAGDRLTAPPAAAAGGGGAGAGADAGGGFAPLLAAGDIVRTFVAESAPKQVNIPASQRVEIEQILASTVIKGAGAVTAGLFDAAYEEVRRLVDRDGFARFRRSPSFQNMMDELRKETDDCDATC